MVTCTFTMCLHGTGWSWLSFKCLWANMCWLWLKSPFVMKVLLFLPVAQSQPRAADSSDFSERREQGAVLLDYLWWSELDSVASCLLVARRGLVYVCNFIPRVCTHEKARELINVFELNILCLDFTQLTIHDNLAFLEISCRLISADLIHRPPATTLVWFHLPVRANPIWWNSIHFLNLLFYGLRLAAPVLCEDHENPRHEKKKNQYEGDCS